MTGFTDSIITPLVNAAGGGGAAGKGLGWAINGQRINLGAFISAIIYFIIFMAVHPHLFSFRRIRDRRRSRPGPASLARSASPPWAASRSASRH
jgi:large-conductance mechanosensitive channel